MILKCGDKKSSSLFFVILPVLFLVGCEDKIKPNVLSSVDSKTLPQQESWNSQITISDSGIVRAVIDAGYFQVFETSRKTLLSEGVKVRFFNPDGSPGSILTSSTGTVDEITNNLEARGNVVVTSTERTQLFTEELYWDNARAMIHSPAFVRIVSPTERLQGVGLESDQSLKNYRIFRVTGETRAR
ncbi:MAG: LPS export ABC transporter periplasmic protein LptC [Ignavibacteria bacterium GWA2_55_11]|nr:MAG: LPS export ABC transporter periplasmic protein LptC [Ignavibacteria bacterium GWA2_55_11]OGU47309.1 MAG: LPS export ABC transporter periplasmic protein LptC [Ignavibacteria bacterium GWC2_56_12]OGU70532.1 MAG: LPS export ABC transporter periplasmic protein LptC [Ignavibacteria bacterium RIFCSPLOWO2_12_FULL_56_21]